MITVVVDVTERKKRDMMQSRLSNAIDSIPSHVMFWDKNEKLIKVNELARKENASEGIELNEGMTYADFLTNQFSAGLYSVPQNFVVEDFVKKRLKERAELTSKSTKIKYKDGKTVIRTVLPSLYLILVDFDVNSALSLSLFFTKSSTTKF